MKVGKCYNVEHEEAGEYVRILITFRKINTEFKKTQRQVIKHFSSKEMSLTRLWRYPLKDWRVKLKFYDLIKVGVGIDFLVNSKKSCSQSARGQACAKFLGRLFASTQIYGTEKS